MFRITDHHNALDPNPPVADCSDTTSCPGTIVDLPIDIGAQCSGGACNYATSADAAITNMVQEGRRAVVGLGQFELWDTGINGNAVGAPPPYTGICPPACAMDSPDAIFARQGLFLP
jgi:hypothetical protein